jgi:alkylation response protein AidB-like acyl-CoA dehydrogenase
MDFSLPAEVAALQREAVCLGADAASALIVREDSWVVGCDRAFSRALGARGWLGMTWPARYGGSDRTPLERFVVTEALIAAGAPLALSWVGDRQIGPTLLESGTEEQRSRYLPGIAAGTTCWSIGLSEPDAGSDVAAIRTVARRDGDHFVVNGRKVWTSFGAQADFCYLIARTDPSAPPHEALSELIVDMRTPGISVHPIRDMSGGAHFAEVTLDGVRVPARDLVGRPGGAFRQVMRQLEHERGGVDRLVSNRALYLDARAVAPDDPHLRQEAAAIEVAYLPTRLQIMRHALGQSPKGASAAVKVLATELEQRIATYAARSFGMATTLEGRVARAVCYAPAYTVQGGTSDVLRNVIAERLLGLPR